MADGVPVVFRANPPHSHAGGGRSSVIVDRFAVRVENAFLNFGARAFDGRRGQLLFEQFQGEREISADGRRGKVRIDQFAVVNFRVSVVRGQDPRRLIVLTNFPTIRKAVKKMANIDKLMNDGTFGNLSKRELLQITRQRAKLEKNLGSIADLTRLPSALFVVDVL
ncbi:MAG: 30S ribosomal protein S2, partial [Thermoguttaceae bacterium]|nr:30S ribosomal protein S2 [Thermoguttaceae bacterium]